jgi:glycerol-3-phosphate acyltransferase PlsY
VTRVLGLKVGIFVFFFDFSKGFITILLLIQMTTDPLLIALSSSSIVLGHCWPLFLKFKGGKGVAPGVGIFSAIAYEIVLIPVLLSLFLIYKTKTASIGSLVGSISSFIPFIIFIVLGIYDIEYLVYYFTTMAIILIRHKENIKRLINNNERKFK